VTGAREVLRVKFLGSLLPNASPGMAGRRRITTARSRLYGGRNATTGHMEVIGFSKFRLSTSE